MSVEGQNEIVERLQLEKRDPAVTVAALAKIFGEEYENLAYLDKTGASKLSKAFDSIKANPKTAQSLCDILYMSEDFEDQLGIHETDMKRECFWQKIHTIGGEKILAQRRSQKIKEGVFDSAPEGRKYEIMNYCVRMNKESFTEEEINAYKPAISGHIQRKWITALWEYNPKIAFKEMIQGKHYHNMSLIYAKKIFESNLIKGNIENLRWRNELDEGQKYTFRGEKERYDKTLLNKQ